MITSTASGESPLPPFIKGGRIGAINVLFHEERKDTGVTKSPFKKGGFRGIVKR